LIQKRTITAITAAALLLLGACSSPPHNTVSDPVRSGRSSTPETRSSRPVSPADSHAALDWARARIGSPYQWGGTGANGFDCSGLVQVAFARMGVNLPRTTHDQAQRGQMVRRDSIQPGDLVFFGDSANSINHVGIATGAGGFVHASSSRGVVEDSLDQSYFRDRYVIARRVTTSSAGN
jgi:cell wall-associated NlpC family hydrolase